MPRATAWARSGSVRIRRERLLQLRKPSTEDLTEKLANGGILTAVDSSSSNARRSSSR